MAVALRAQSRDTRATMAERDAVQAEGDKPLSTEQEAERHMEELAISDDGERMIPEFHHDALIYAEHVVRYLFASRLVRGKRVLDVGSGVGYGSNMLKGAGAAKVIGLDRSREAIAYGLDRHAALHPDYLVADAESLPLQDGQFDVVVSFETLEHVADYHRFLEEAKRVMRPGGLLILSTPNKGIYIGGNPFHTKEFTFAELGETLRNYFRHVEIFAQDNWITGAILAPSTMERADSRIADGVKVYKTVEKPANKALYIVSLCSDASVPKAGQELALTDIWVERRYVEEISRLGADIHRLSTDVAERDAVLVQRDALLAEKDTALAEKDAAVAEYEAALVEKDGVLVAQDTALNESRAVLAGVAQELEVIRRSRSYLLISGLRRRLSELFPAGTLRGRALRKAQRLARRWLERRWRTPVRQEPALAAEEADYERWIAENEPTAAELDRQRAWAKELPYRPLISIVTPTYNTPPLVLRETIESVLAQTYDQWELCIADGDSGPAVRKLLKEFAGQDRRIKVKLLNENQGIAGNTNEALAMARGDMVAFLDHDDVLAPFALFTVAELLNRNPELDLIYSDHDFLSEDGKRRYGVQFKPEWSPSMLISANYILHLCVLRRQFVERLGGLMPEMEGAQDWDLLLRAGEATTKIARIPQVLYHWRALPSSFAGVGFDAKPYQKTTLKKAVSSHLARRGLQGDVLVEERGEQKDLFVRIKWSSVGQPKVSAIIPTKHNRKLLKRCLRSLRACAYPNLEIIVIETAGRTRAREAWYRRIQEEIPLRILWWKKPFNWSAVCNLGAREADGDVLLFLNDDTEILTPDSLEEMLGWVQQPDVGCVGAQLLSPDGRIQHGGMTAGMFGFADYLFRGALQDQGTFLGSTGWCRDLLAVSGACNMVRREVFDEVGGWDESFILCGSDSVFCFRVHEAGYRVMCTPYAKVLHHEGATRGRFIPKEDFYTSYWPYQKYLRGGDPFFNPNLSLFHHIPRLKSTGEDSATAEVSRILGRDLTPARQRIEEESRILSEACKISTDPDATLRLHEKTRGRAQVKSINWFIPDFETPFYGGVHTILRFADYFRRKHNVNSRFVVLGTGPEEYIRSALRLAFPSLSDSDIIICSPWNDAEIRALPGADVAIATQWLTAYVVSRVERTRRKFYLIQDFEPMFYPAGTVYALAEQTYRMGLYGIASGPTLREMYEGEYGGSAIHYNSCVDTSLFHPGNSERKSDGPFRVFLFGRPGHWRSSYELAISALGILKARWKDQLHIITAGSWAVSTDPVGASIVDNLGLLDYKATPELYRSCDVGLVLTMSKNPSYVTLEMLASGSLVISNYNRAASWLLRDGENCLLTEPTAESLYHAIEKGLLDRELRRRLTDQAVADIRERHSDWEPEMEKVYQYLCDPDALPEM